MSDRYHSLIVVLDHDMRDDDAESLMEAIRHLRGVTSVEGNVTKLESHVAQARARNEIRGKIMAILYDEKHNT